MLVNAVYWLIFSPVLSMAAGTYRPGTGVKSGLGNAIAFVHSAIAQFCLVFGIGMLLLSVYKFMEYRKNPLANPLSSVISFILTGVALIGVYYIPMQTVMAG